MLKLRNKMKPNFSDEYLGNLADESGKMDYTIYLPFERPITRKGVFCFFDMLYISDTSFLLHIISCSASQALQSNLFIWQFSQHQKHVCNKRCFVKTGFFWFGIISSSSSVFKLIFFNHLN